MIQSYEKIANVHISFWEYFYFFRNVHHYSCLSYSMPEVFMLIRIIENFPFRAINKPTCKIVGCRVFSKAGGNDDGRRDEAGGGGAGNEAAIPLKFVFHPSNLAGVL